MEMWLNLDLSLCRVWNMGSEVGVGGSFFTYNFAASLLAHYYCTSLSDSFEFGLCSSACLHMSHLFEPGLVFAPCGVHATNYTAIIIVTPCNQAARNILTLLWRSLNLRRYQLQESK